MDEKYGGAGYWNVVVGESFDVSTVSCIDPDNPDSIQNLVSFLQKA